MKNANLIASIASIVSSLVIIGAILFWAPPCQSTLELARGATMPMRCTFTAKAALLFALLIIVVCIASLATKRPMTAAIVALSTACIVISLDTPLSIGLCPSSMACSTMALWLRGAAIASIIAALFGFGASDKRKKVKA